MNLEFLNNFKVDSKQVGIFISSNSIMEVIEYDSDEKIISKYARTHVEYDLSKREIVDLYDFKKELQKIFHDLEIKQGANVVLCLPTVLMGNITLPSVLDADAIRMALTSETERSYIFKKQTPNVNWVQLKENTEDETTLYSYSAFQQEHLIEVEEAIKETGAKVIAIDNSYTSLIRGLSYTTFMDESLLQSGKEWNAIIVTSNSIAILTCKDKKIISTIEEPVAIKSFTEEDLYPAIANIAAKILRFREFSKLFIVSETDDVSAEILESYITFDCEKINVESNKFSKNQLYPCSLNVLPNFVSQVSPFAMGCVSWGKSPINFNFNFIEKAVAFSSAAYEVAIFGYKIPITSKILEYIMLGLVVLICIILSVVYFVVASISGARGAIYNDLSTQQQELSQKVQEQSKDTQINNTDFLNIVYNSNKDITQSFTAMAETIPPKLWLDMFEVRDDLTVYMKGKAYDINDVINFYRSLNQFAKFKEFKISTLKVAGAGSLASDTSINVVQKPQDSNQPAAPGLPALPSINESSLMVDPSVSGKQYYEFEYGKIAEQNPAGAPGAAPAPTVAPSSVPPNSPASGGPQ